MDVPGDAEERDAARGWRMGKMLALSFRTGKHVEGGYHSPRSLSIAARYGHLNTAQLYSKANGREDCESQASTFREPEKRIC